MLLATRPSELTKSLKKLARQRMAANFPGLRGFSKSSDFSGQQVDQSKGAWVKLSINFELLMRSPAIDS